MINRHIVANDNILVDLNERAAFEIASMLEVVCNITILPRFHHLTPQLIFDPLKLLYPVFKAQNHLDLDTGMPEFHFLESPDHRDIVNICALITIGHSHIPIPVVSISN